MPSGIQKLLRLFVCLASSIAGLVVGGFLGLALGLRITGAGGLHGIDLGAMVFLLGGGIGGLLAGMKLGGRLATWLIDKSKAHQSSGGSE